MNPRPISVLGMIMAGLLVGPAGGCATGHALVRPDSNPNRVFAGTRISAFHDPSSLVGDVLVLPVTVPQTLINWATGRFRKYEQDRARAFAARELERGRLGPLTATLSPAGTDSATGAYTSFTIVLNREVYTFTPASLSLTRDGVPVSLNSATLSRNREGPTTAIMTLSADVTAPAGDYVLTLKAERIKDTYALPLEADASFAWTRGPAGSVPGSAPATTPGS